MSYLPNTTYVQFNSDQGVTMTDNNGNIYIKESTFPDFTYSNSNSPLNTIKFQNDKGITVVIFGTNVSSLPNQCFSRCTSLQNITISNTVTTIGSSAFFLCKLNSVVIPDSVTVIGGGAFQDCTSLMYFTIGSGLNNFGGNALNKCYALLSITVNANNSTYSNYNNDGNLYDKSITTLIQYATGNLNTSFSIPSTVTLISNNSLSWCPNLTSVTIPSATTSIGTGTFSNSSKLSSITFTPTSNLNSFGSVAFQNCSSLLSIDIPATVKTISNQVFQYCTSLRTINVVAGNTVYSNNNSDGNLYNFAKTSLIQYALGNLNTSFTIPSTVNTISSYAFQNCTALVSVIIPSSVTTINSFAFQGSNLLTRIILPITPISISANSNAFSDIATRVSINGSTTNTPVPANMFYGNTTITSIEINPNITSIGSSAFQNCTNLNTAFVYSNQLVTTSTTAFQSITTPSTLYTTTANLPPNNLNLTNQFTYVFLYIPLSTNYYTIQSNVQKDLIEVFSPLTIGTQAQPTNFFVDNYGLSKDLNELFEPYTSGTQAQPTNFLVDNYLGTGVTIDLNQIFKPI